LGTKADEIFVYRLQVSAEEESVAFILMQTIPFRYAVNDISCNGRFLAVASGDGSVVLFEEEAAAAAAADDFQKWTKTDTLRIHTADCFCARFSADGKLLCTGGADAQVTVWSTTERHFVPLRCLNRMEWPIRALSFNFDARFLAVGTEDTFVALEDWQSGQLVAKCVMSRGGSRGVAINCVSWHPSKNIFAFAGEEVNERNGRFTGSIRLIGLC
jgi:WD40 repeat protein